MDEKKSGIAYWKANIRLILILLAVWALASYVLGIILAPVLNNITFGNLPLGFWIAQQGSMFTFIILIFVYSILMDRVDQEHDVQE